MLSYKRRSFSMYDNEVLDIPDKRIKAEHQQPVDPLLPFSYNFSSNSFASNSFLNKLGLIQNFEGNEVPTAPIKKATSLPDASVAYPNTQTLLNNGNHLYFPFLMQRQQQHVHTISPKSTTTVPHHNSNNNVNNVQQQQQQVNFNYNHENYNFNTLEDFLFLEPANNPTDCPSPVSSSSPDSSVVSSPVQYVPQVETSDLLNLFMPAFATNPAAPSSSMNSVNNLKGRHAQNNIFELRKPLNATQRKSYKSENRYILPYPVIGLKETEGGKHPEIMGGMVSVELVDKDGRSLPAGKQTLLESTTGGGISQLINPPSLQSSKFLLKITENSGGDVYCLKFTVNYVTSDKRRETETIYSNAFTVQSVQKKKEDKSTPSKIYRSLTR